MYEGDDLNTLDDATPPEEKGNKTFVLVAAIIGGIVLLSIACLAVYGLYYIPRQTTQRNAQQATLVAQNLQVDQGLTEKAVSDMLSQVAAASPTLEPTQTPVFQASTPTTQATSDPQTATVAAALTQAAQAQLTVTALPTSTALPNTGFLDDVGAPGLAIMAVALVIVILLARRLRTTPAK
jgi:hypothetical protein